MTEPCSFPIPAPTRRRLRVFVGDPLVQRGYDDHMVLDIPNEALTPGPVGERIAIIDYDAVLDCYYQPVDLNAPALLMQDGIAPSESSDPRFHQQMVYAVAMKVLETFDRALGRRIYFECPLKSVRRPLRLFPHAFQQRNAFYDPSTSAIYFGYFRTTATTHGDNHPNQYVYTCLSHDIITHEMTHALLHRIRPNFLHVATVEALAFHEGFADLITILQKFSFPSVLRKVLAEHRGSLRSHSSLVDLAEQFGNATKLSGAVRTALLTPNPESYKKPDTEPHTLGALLVAAVIDAMTTVYERRVADLIRIVTGGAEQLPATALGADLLNRLSYEAAETARIMQTMCIRALEYTPPHGITFGDYLRALITADYDLYPSDEGRFRENLVEAFRQRGIYATDTDSLETTAVRYGDGAEELPGFLKIPSELVIDMLLREGRKCSTKTKEETDAAEGPGTTDKLEADAASPNKKKKPIYGRLVRFGVEHAAALGLVNDRERCKIMVNSFHLAVRLNSEGLLNIDCVVQFTQTMAPASDGQSPGRMGGTTVIASVDGRVRYVIKKPLAEAQFGATAITAEKSAAAAAYRACIDSLDAVDNRRQWRPLPLHEEQEMWLARLHHPSIGVSDV